MLTVEEREKLRRPINLKNWLGYDCNGEVIEKGDMVEVVRADKNRKSYPKYDYGSVGKQGKAVNQMSGWTITVEFDNNGKPQTLGCTDINLRKV